MVTVTSGSRTLVAKGFGTQDWDSYVVWIENGTGDKVIAGTASGLVPA